MDKNKLNLLVSLYHMNHLSKKEVDEVITLLKELNMNASIAKLNSF